ncbi:MAG: GntR family transcriptional regulator [Pseudonocardia sp.]
MHPRLERPDPPYRQLVKHYRDAILSGSLASGDRLPATRTMAEEWDVAYTTVAKALRQLQSEGLVSTSNQGAFVSWHETSTYSPRDRLRAARTTGRLYPVSELSRIVAADLVESPEHVAHAMGTEQGAQVIRRARVNFHEDIAVTYSVSWLPGNLVEPVPELTTLERLPGGTIGRIAEVTGRTVLRDRYRECARRATVDEARHLGVTPGDPVLAGQNWWYEDTNEQSVLEFGEYTIPEGRWVTVGHSDA